MKPFVVRPASFLKGKISPPGDKSITHRAIILSSLSKGVTTLKNFPLNKDCMHTLNAFKKLGIKASQKNNRGRHSATIKISAKGRFGLKKPACDIFVGDSGTTLRLLLGVLAGQNFKTRLVTGKSLSKRPMRRVTEPLRMMGAKIQAREKGRIEEYSPITIKGGVLRPIIYKIPAASAQVKTAIFLAALYAHGNTKVIEPLKTRDHTERMLKLFKADIKTQGDKIEFCGGRPLVSPKNIYIPGDISSASFFIVASVIIPGSRVTIKKVNLNPSRMGIVSALKRMGADLHTTYNIGHTTKHEPIGDILVKASPLKGLVVRKKDVPFLIDELPVLMVAASLAKGESVFEDVGELRVKETDRIKSMSENLTKMGANISISKRNGVEKLIIKGVKHLMGAKVRSFGDHRTAMSMVVAGLAACGNTRIDDISCIDKSFPDFLNILKTLLNK